MFRLPTSNANGMSYLSDVSSVLLLDALLSDDLDDRLDILRQALATDPLLACWAVQEAAAREQIQLTTQPMAARWLEQRCLSILCDDAETLQPADGLTPASKSVWGSIRKTSLAAAEQASYLALQKGCSSQSATWYALLSCTHTQIQSLGKMNGHSPLKDLHCSPPKWLMHSADPHSADRAPQEQAQIAIDADAWNVARLAVQMTSSTNSSNWLDVNSDAGNSDATKSDANGQAATEASRNGTLPNAKRIVPAMLSKLHRLRQLETEFSSRLHEEKMAAMQQLAYGASHEINNPLANISTRAQSLIKNELDADRRRKLHAINNQAFRAYEMIADLMLFAKPPKLDWQTVPLKPMLEQIRTEVESQSNEQMSTESQGSDRVPGIVCHIRMGANPDLCLPGDAAHLAAAIKAVCTNGIDAMGGQGELRIEVSSQHPHEVEIAIEDSGTGLNELAQRHLFDPFFSGREAGRGLGFGLSKAWRIIEQHNGRIEVRSEVSRGSRFTITLPTEESAKAAPPDVQD